MSRLQKIIKYLSLAFAIFLVVNIISSIFLSISFIENIFFDNENTSKLENIEINSDLIYLNIDLSNTSLTIKKGETLKFESNNENLILKEEDKKIKVSEKANNWFNNKESKFIIYIPDDYVFDEVILNSKAGSLDIEQLNTKKLNLDLGAGKTNISNLTVYEKTIINGGAGKIDINSSYINNLELDIGVGKLNLESKLEGNNKIDSGIGKVDILLIGTTNDYKIELEKGIGSIKVDGILYKDDLTYGSGINSLKIDGGIGSINLNFKNE